MELKLLSSDYFYDPVFPLKVIERNPELPYPLHSHDFYELVLIVSGKGTHFTTKGSFTILPGHVFIVAPSVQHGFRDVEDLRLYNILFDPKILDQPLYDLLNMPGYHSLLRLEAKLEDGNCEITPLQLSPAQLAELLPLVEQMLKESDSIEYDIGAKTLAFAYFIHFMVRLFRIEDEHPRLQDRTLLRLANVFSFLESNLDRAVSSQELMELTNMSSSTLNRHFNEATGLSPIEFHIQRRLEYASRLLRYSTLSISEIAEKTGFEDANYFSRQFKKVIGVSPSQYRNNRSLWLQTS
ncbi:MAG: helix-turn-helix domain-containing protein [Sphaerochaetaceae bacterium]